MKTSTAALIALVIIVGAGYFAMRDTSMEASPSISVKNGITSDIAEGDQNSVIKDGVQYVTIVARGGYAPRKSFAMAGIPTKFIIKTSGTYDCSASLVISSLNFRQMLPNTGDTIIDAGIPKVDDKVQGVCAMGMYSFAVEFK